jgi:hypothetical protein
VKDETSDFSALEAELRQFSPGVPAANLEQRTARDVASAVTHPWSDRCLMGAIGTGLAAAIAVVVMLGSDWVVSRRSTPPATYAQMPAVLQTREYLAQLTLGLETPPPPGTIAATAPN